MHTLSLIRNYFKDPKFFHFALKCLINLWKDNIFVLLSTEEYLDQDGEKLSGFFDSESSQFAVALGSSSAKGVFVHEYCHYEQYKENAKVWTDLYVMGKDACETLEEWLNHDIELTPEEAIRLTTLIGLMEADCERRAVDKIKEHGMNIDTVQYIKEANAYVTLYFLMPKYRSWYKKNSPGKIKSILSKMPDHFDVDYVQLAAQVDKLYAKYVF